MKKKIGYEVVKKKWGSQNHNKNKFPHFALYIV